MVNEMFLRSGWVYERFLGNSGFVFDVSLLQLTYSAGVWTNVNTLRLFYSSLVLPLVTLIRLYSYYR